MSKSCSRCDAEDGPMITLRNVSFSGELFSKLVSRKVVCPDCRDDMKNDDRWDW